MIHPHPVAKLFTRPARRHQSRFGEARISQSERRRETMLCTWRDAFVLFDARIQMLQLWSTDLGEISSKPELDWCVACVADVRSALYQLHVCVADERLSLPPHGPAIVSYLSEAYVWYGDVLEDFKALVHDLRGGPQVRDPTVSEDSSAYIDDFLQPLFHDMCESCGENGPGQPKMRALMPLAERLHVAIVSLDWTLKAVA